VYRALILVMFIMLAACSQDEMLQKFSSPEDRATTEKYVELLRAHNFSEIEKATDPSVKETDIHGKLEEMARLLPSGKITSVKLIGAQTHKTPGMTIKNTTLEYNYDGKWVLANVAIQEKNGAKTIVGFNIVPQPGSQESINRFTLSNKSILHYTVLSAAFLGLVISLFALLRCMRSKSITKKWKWIVFIIFGFGKLTINWTTGQWNLTPISFQLFSASAVAPFYGPWNIAASLPIGAVVFLLMRKKLLAPKPNCKVDDPTNS